VGASVHKIEHFHGVFEDGFPNNIKSPESNRWFQIGHIHVEELLLQQIYEEIS